MQIVSVSLFDSDMSVAAYLLRYNTGSGLFAATLTTNRFDGIGQSPLLDALNEAGVDAFAMDKPMFVPINPMLLLTGLDVKCKQPPERIVFLFESFPGTSESITAEYLQRIDALRELGYRFAIAGIDRTESYRDVLGKCEYCFIPQDGRNAAETERLMKELRRGWRDVICVAENIQDADSIKELGRMGYSLFESRFFKLEHALVETTVSPLKMNLIQLMNTVQDSDFAFLYFVADTLLLAIPFSLVCAENGSVHLFAKIGGERKRDVVELLVFALRLRH
jgi:c-di-GMP-related signal transduction protein